MSCSSACRHEQVAVRNDDAASGLASSMARVGPAEGPGPPGAAVKGGHGTAARRGQVLVDGGCSGNVSKAELDTLLEEHLAGTAVCLRSRYAG
jgi:hypothetical protein